MPAVAGTPDPRPGINGGLQRRRAEIQKYGSRPRSPYREIGVCFCELKQSPVYSIRFRKVHSQRKSYNRIQNTRKFHIVWTYVAAFAKKRHNSTKISSQESEKALRQNEKNKAEMAANLSTNVTKRHTVYGFLMNCMVRYTSNSTTESAQSTAFKRPKREGKRSFPGQKKPYKIRSPAREQGPAGAGRILSQADANSRTAAEKKCFSSQTAF